MLAPASTCTSRRPGDEAAASKTRAGPAYRLAQGDRFVYQLRYTSLSGSDFRVLLARTPQQLTSSNLANEFKVALRGKLVTTVLGKSSEKALLAYRMRDSSLELKVNGETSPREAETIRTDLEREIFAELNREGRILSVRFDPAVGRLSHHFARTLLAAVQFVCPSRRAPGHLHWESEEDDPAGHFLSRYESFSRADAASGRRLRYFRKTRLRYFRFPLDAKPGHFELPTAILPTGSLLARFDLEAGHLSSLEGSESQEIAISGKTVGRSRADLQMAFQSRQTVGAEELSAMEQAAAAREKIAAAVPLSVKELPEVTRAAIDRSELGSATLDSLLTDLVAAEHSEDTANDETRLYLKFKALISLHPASSAALGKVLAAADPKSRTMRIVAGALGAVGHEQAQAALVSAIRSRTGDWPALALLLPALSTAPSPSELATETVRDLALESKDPAIASTAQLALAAMARNMATNSPGRAAEIVGWILAKMHAAVGESEKRQFLLMLGNAGSAAGLPAIARHLTDRSPALRAAAASALRWIESSRAEELLRRALTYDPESAVRLEAAVALGFRNTSASTYAFQKDAFLRDKAVDVRLAILKNLWGARRAFPEVRRLVQEAAAADDSGEIREAATEILAMYSDEISQPVGPGSSPPRKP